MATRKYIAAIACGALAAANMLCVLVSDFPYLNFILILVALVAVMAGANFWNEAEKMADDGE